MSFRQRTVPPTCHRGNLRFEVRSTMVRMMFEPSLAPVLRWIVLGFVCALPTLLSIVGLLAHQRGRFRRRGSWLPQAAGPWLEEQIRGLGMDVPVEVHEREGMDAYIPGVGTIGLSQRTWGGCRPGDWAIAAHELGHAINMRSHPLVAQLLPTARLAQHHLWRAFCAALCCAALLRDPALLPLSLTVLVLSVLVSVVVCADEVGASIHGFRLLQRDQRIRGGDPRIIRSSMVSAGWVYALGLSGQAVTLACWPAIVTIVPEVVPAPAFEPSPIALWLFVALVPVLLLRAAHVLIQVLNPEPVTTDFRLFTVMHREGQWEFMAGIGVMALVVGLHPLLADPVGAVALVLATMNAIGPVGGLLSGLILFPVLMIGRRWWERIEQEDDDGLFAPPAIPDQGAPALMALYTNPPWYLRMGWLAHLAYLPLLGLLLLRLVS